MAFAAVKLVASEGSILISYLQNEWNSFMLWHLYSYCNLFFYSDQISASNSAFYFYKHEPAYAHI